LVNQSRRLGEFLVERHVLSRDALEAALEEEARTGTPLPAVLVRSGAVAEKDLVAAVANGADIRFVDLAETPLHPDATQAIPAEIARRHLALGVCFEAAQLVVAFADPGNKEAVSAVHEACGWEVVPAISERKELLRAIDAVYGPAPAGTAPAAAGDADLLRVTIGEEAAPRPRDAEPDLHINDFLGRVLELSGSDLHLTAGSPPMVRVHGDLLPMSEFPVLNGSQIRQLVYAVITQKQRERFEDHLELDTSHTIPGQGRFRVNVMLQKDSVGAVLRVIPYEIVPLDALGLPPAVAQFSQLTRGLVLVTGPTGSGKSTTLASLIDIINRTKPVHIMTVEDPIEFLHNHKRAVVNQREVGEDTHSFANALKHVLRQDPDVILVGEMRDLETISTALTAAETGHLVFATLHTQDAPQSVDRVIDVFPSHQQQQIRVQLAASLQGIVTQQLVAIAGGHGRAVAAEVLVATPAIRNLVREGKTHQIYSMMQAGGKYGMQTMDQSLAQLVRTGKISLETATEKCANEEDLRRLLGGGGSH
jgi:twitching motility protein PilT